MKNNKKDKKIVLNTIPATIILLLLTLVLVLIGYAFLYYRNGYALEDLIDNVVGNLIGVLAAFCLFDILYNKLTKDEYARDVSKAITKTLMGDSDTLDAFDDKDKKNFMLSTINSMIHDKDAVDMIVAHMDKYMEFQNVPQIRKRFNYVITLSTEFPEDYNDFPGVSDKKYYYVQENLNYELKYLTDKHQNLDSHDVKIGFPFDKRNLDVGLLKSNEKSEFSKCVFNENLDISPEAIEFLFSLPVEKIKDIYQSLFTVVLKVDDHMGELKNVELNGDGIVATYHVNHNTEKNEHSVKIIFHMPKLWNSIFEVTLVDPTLNPQITFDYMPGKMDVNMYSYLNKGIEANDGAYEHQNGLFDISIKEDWIYPKSGIIFTVNKKHNKSDECKNHNKLDLV